MTRKKKIILLCIVGVLLAGGLTTFLVLHKRNSFKENLTQNEKSVRLSKKLPEEEGPDRYFQLEEGGFYLVVVDQDTAYVQIERVDDEEIGGNYYPLTVGSEMVEAHSFIIEAHRRTISLKLGEKEYVFALRADKLHDLMDEQRHSLTEEGKRRHTVEMHPYREPAFRSFASDRYKKEIYRVSEMKDIVYGHATGYWTSFVGSEEESYATIVREGLKNSLSAKELDLELDLYLPQDEGDTTTGGKPSRPLLLFLHGGAFYVGDKSDPAISDWCRHFAATGYVAASINYRMGFIPSKKEIERAGYQATQDASQALRFLVSKWEEYHIDTNRIFVAGTSAGAITSLNLAFLRSIPDLNSGRRGGTNTMSANQKKGKQRNNRNAAPGDKQRTSIELKNTSPILAVANMWGAVDNLNNLKNSRTSIISFHGDADPLVPYDQGYPFADISEQLGKRLFGQMYGSKAIDQRARELGMTSELYTFPGEGHALHLNEDRSRNTKNFNFIRDHITSFFYRAMVPHPAQIVVDPSDARHYLVDNPNVEQVYWRIQGGWVLRQKGNEVWIVWRKESGDHRLVSIAGRYRNGIPFSCQMKPKVTSNN